MKMWRRQRPWSALLGASLMVGLSGCGQKGPLYLPDHKPEAVPGAAAETPATRKAPRTPDPAAQR